MQNEMEPVSGGKKVIKTSTGMIVIFAAVVLFFGGALSYWYYNDPNSYDTSKDSTIVATTVPNSNTNASNTNVNGSANVNANTNSSSATADWKTYTNDTYKFSLKYPNDWAAPVPGAISPAGSSLAMIDMKNPASDATIYVQVMKNAFSSISEWVTSMNNNDMGVVYTQKDVTVGGNAGKELSTTIGATRTGVIEGENLFVIHLLSEETSTTKVADLATYQTMLSTFQFIK